MENNIVLDATWLVFNSGICFGVLKTEGSLHEYEKKSEPEVGDSENDVIVG